MCIPTVGRDGAEERGEWGRGERGRGGAEERGEWGRDEWGGMEQRRGVSGGGCGEHTHTHTHTHTHRWVGGATTFTHHIPQWMKLGARIVGEQPVKLR